MPVRKRFSYARKRRLTNIHTDQPVNTAERLLTQIKNTSCVGFPLYLSRDEPTIAKTYAVTASFTVIHEKEQENKKEKRDKKKRKKTTTTTTTTKTHFVSYFLHKRKKEEET